MSQIDLLDRFRGCLLGLAVGDAVGAPFESLDAETMIYEFGSVHKIVHQPPIDTLIYTDDTEMTLGVAEALLAKGRIETAMLSECFVRNYHADRGYGSGTRKIIEALAAGQAG